MSGMSTRDLGRSKCASDLHEDPEDSNEADGLNNCLGFEVWGIGFRA